MEVLEREIEVDWNPGVYPHLALGPGQRFAAKGCSIVKLAPGHRPSSQWPPSLGDGRTRCRLLVRAGVRRAANGERYRRTSMTAAHRSLPFGTRVQVKNLENGATVVVTINDRGPFARGRIIDLSYQAARELGVSIAGTADVELAVLGQDPPETRYTVQVGAFSDPDYAVLLHRELKRTYPEAYVHSDGIWNRVQVGLFTDRENAENLRRELGAMGMSAIVVAAAQAQ